MIKSKKTLIDLINERYATNNSIIRNNMNGEIESKGNINHSSIGSYDFFNAISYVACHFDKSCIVDSIMKILPEATILFENRLDLSDSKCYCSNDIDVIESITLVDYSVYRIVINYMVFNDYYDKRYINKMSNLEFIERFITIYDKNNFNYDDIIKNHIKDIDVLARHYLLKNDPESFIDHMKGIYNKHKVKKN